MVAGCNWSLRFIWSTYLIFVLIFAGCDGHTVKPQLLPPEQTCLSKQARGSCFYEKDSSSKKKSKLIVFVHGIFSSPEDTWGNVTSGNTWPHLAKSDERFSEFDYYLIKYHTTYFTNAQMIHEIAIREMDALKDSDEFTQYKEIYFITHSMGGLVAKSLLTHLNRGDDVGLLRRVKAIIFLGTPSQGASEAVLGNWLSRNIQLEQLKPAHLNPWLSDLENYWSQLIDDRKESQYPRSFCAYETLSIFLGYIVVPREAAASKCDGPAVGLPFNHSDLAMPTSKDQDPYKWVMDKIYDTTRSLKPIADGSAVAAAQPKPILEAGTAAAAHRGETCGPVPFKTRSRARFLPRWVNHINTLKDARGDEEDYDLLNLIAVRKEQRILVDEGTIPESILIQEALFTLKCLEQENQLRLTKPDHSKMVGGTVENQKIIFLKSKVTVPE